MLHLYLKSLHIIGFVSWFAGLFYLVRIFVYHTEATKKPEPLRTELKKEFSAMQWRVYKIICNPGMMITWTFGIMMLINTPAFLSETWLQTKLVLLVILTVYHIYCKSIIKKQEKGEAVFTSFQFRLLNEFPTLFLVAIVLLAVVKNMLNFMYLFMGIIVFGVILYFSAKAYKNHREKIK